MNQNELNQKITSLQTGLSNVMNNIESLSDEEKQIPKTKKEYPIVIPFFSIPLRHKNGDFKTIRLITDTKFESCLI